MSTNTWNPTPGGYGATWQSVIPAPTLTSRGGVYMLNPVANYFVTGTDATGRLLTAQPTFANFSGQLSPGQIPSGYTIDSPNLTGTPKTPNYTGFLYANGGTGWTASVNIPAAVLTGTIAGQRLPAPTATVFGGVLSAIAPANQFQRGIDTTGAPQFAQPSFSNLSGTATGSQLPAPTATSFGGVLAATAGTNQFQRGIDTAGNPLFAQPSFANLSGQATGAQLPAPTATTFGGVFSSSAPANQFQTGINTMGAPTFAQASFANLSGSATASQMPAFSGDASTPAGSTVITFNTVNVNVGSFGSSTAIPSFTVNGKGLLTAAGSNPVVAPAGTLTGATLAAGVTGSSLTSVGTVTAGTWNATRIGHAYRVQAPTLTLRGNPTGATADVSDNSLTAYLDAETGSTAQGYLPVRGATKAQAIAPGTSGQVLTSNGAGALPSYQAPGAGSAVVGFRNRLINGDIRIDQRNNGASQSFTAGSALVYTVDRWYVFATGGNPTGQRVAGSAGTQFRYQFTGATGVTAITFGQRIETTNCLDMANTTVTLSVDLANSLLTSVGWSLAYANSADSFGGTGAQTVTVISSGTFAVSSTLTRYSVQVSVPAAAVTGLQLQLSVGAQTSGTWVIGNVQLEPGAVATTFEKRNITFEIAASQRYYWLAGAMNGLWGGSTTTFSYVVLPPVTMRTTANILLINANVSGGSVLEPTVAQRPITGLSGTTVPAMGGRVDLTTSAASGSTRGGIIEAGALAFSAEL